MVLCTRVPPVSSIHTRENTRARVSVTSVQEMTGVMQLIHPTFNPVPTGFVIFTEPVNPFQQPLGNVLSSAGWAPAGLAFHML